MKWGNPMRKIVAMVGMIFLLSACQNIADFENDVMQTYLDVLQDRINIHTRLYFDWPNPQCFQSSYLSLSDYLMEIGEGISWEIIEFAVVDMTDNGENDLVLSLRHPQIMENISLVLIYENGSVYGNIFTHRNMSDIKSDGSFYRRISGHWTAARLDFTKGVFSSSNVFIEEQDKRESVIMFPFSAETIAYDLPIAWRYFHP